MQFHFADLINKYSVACTLICFEKGKYVAGDYEKGKRTDTDTKATIISMSQNRIYQSGGSLTTADRTMYILKSKDPVDLEDGKTYYVQHNGKKYKVEEAGLYGEDYADFNEYTLKRVEAFDV